MSRVFEESFEKKETLIVGQQQGIMHCPLGWELRAEDA